MLVIDRNYLIESISDNGLVLLHGDRDRLIGRECYRVVHGQDAPPPYCPMLASGGLSKTLPVTGNAVLAYGQFSVRCMALRDEDGAVIRVLGLTESAAVSPPTGEPGGAPGIAAGELLDSIPEPLLLADALGVITLANPEACRLLGYAEGDLLDRSIYDLMPGKERRPFQERWRRVLSDATPQSVEQVFARRDGSSFHGCLGASILRDSQGDAAAVIVLIKDMSRSEQARLAASFSDAVLTTMRESVIAWDNEHAISHWNGAAEQTYGLSAEEAIGKKVEDIFDRIQPSENGNIQWIEAPATAPERAGNFLFRARRRPVVTEGQVTTIERDGKRHGWMAVTADITEQQEMARHIGLMDAAVASSPRAIIMTDLAGRLTYANAAFRRLWGFAVGEETSDAAFADLWKPGAEHKNAVRQAQENGPWTGELTARRRDGSVFEVEAAVSVVRDPQQHPLRVLASFTDITETKKARLELEDSRGFISSLLDNSHHPRLVINPDTSIRYANAALEKLTGFVTSELVGRKAPYPWVVPDSMPRTVREVRIAMSRGPKWFEELYRKKNGKQFWVEVTSAPVMQNGVLSYYLVGWVDITDRHLIEEELTKERDRHKTYLDTVGVMVATVDSQGHITMVNRKTCETLGYIEKELVGQNWYRFLIPPRNRSQVRKTFRTIFSQGSPSTNGAKHSEGVLLTRAGEEKLFTFTHTLLRVPGRKAAQILISGEDTTELRKTQEQLEHSHLLASLGEMTAGIAHEVNNPLGSILLYSELLMAGDAPPQVKKDLKIIHDEAKRATRVMTDLLIYGRRTKPQVRRINLNTVVRKVLDMRRYQHKVQNITVTTELADGPLFVKGDASQLMQVVMNIVLNAEDALREKNGGTIHVTSSAALPWARLRISDDGPGIPTEYLNQIFYPFFTTKPVGEGTGLGLSICYGIVTAHNGLIKAENRKTGGATFTIELPIGNGKDSGNGHAAGDVRRLHVR